MEIYDTVAASTLEDGDNIVFNTALFENVKVIDSGSAVMIKGFSYDTGDIETIIVESSDMIDLWQA